MTMEEHVKSKNKQVRQQDRPNFEVGDRVVVMAGLFDGCEGIIEEIEEGMRFPYKVRVSVNPPSLKSNETQCMYYSESYICHCPRTITIKIYKDLIIAGDNTDGAVVSRSHHSRNLLEEYSGAISVLGALENEVERCNE